jgi:hypothetical protein
MSLGVPRNIGKIGVPQNIARAQSTKTSMLNQKVDRQNARVSMNQVMGAKAEARGEKTTSINRVGSMGNIAQTSSARYQTNIKTSVNDTVSYDQNTDYRKGADDQRAVYVQRLIRARKEKEARLAKTKGTP